MRTDRILAAVGMSGLLLSVLFVAGCGRGSSGSGSTAPEVQHMRHAAVLVGEYERAAKKRPAKIEEVRDWAVKEGKGSEDDFVSTRDKELYIIAYTTRGLVVHEKAGKNGKCYMLSMGSASEMRLEDAQHLVEQMQVGPGGKPKQKKGKSGQPVGNGTSSKV